MKVENLARAEQISVDLRKLKKAQAALNDGGQMRVYYPNRRDSGDVLLDVDDFNELFAECVKLHIEKLENEIETL